MSKSTTLYRFFGVDDELLYIGITERGPERWKGHRKEKLWWPLVARVTVQHFDTREHAADAERLAIITENPTYNIIHNKGGEDRPYLDPPKSHRWSFVSSHGYPRDFRELWLAPEPNCLACVDDSPSSDPREWVEYWIDYLQRHDYDLAEVSVYWTVQSEGVAETAPFIGWEQNFLTHFSWPYDTETGERLNWFSLPVKERFVGIFDALGWWPSPLQRTMPLADIIRSRSYA